jgi:hypothetical protein
MAAVDRPPLAEISAEPRRRAKQQQPAAARRREQQRGWQRAWRRRVREGAKLTEVPGSIIELLLASQWLKPDEADDKRAITDALDAFARDALKRFR